MKNFWMNCGICLGASFVMILCVEGFMRFFPFKNSYGPLQEWMIPHVQYHHFHKPNSTAIEILETEEGRKVQKSYFDSQGMRDFPPLQGLTKVVFIGDSFVQANQVDIHEMFGNILETRVKGIDVLNIGCSSWSSIIYWNWLNANIDQVPKLKSVYLFYFPNDVYDTLKYWQDADRQDSLEKISFFQYVERKRKEEKPIKSWLYRHSRLYFLMVEAKRIFQEKRELSGKQLDGSSTD
jgi:hypothetical protein